MSFPPSGTTILNRLKYDINRVWSNSITDHIKLSDLKYEIEPHNVRFYLTPATFWCEALTLEKVLNGAGFTCWRSLCKTSVNQVVVGCRYSFWSDFPAFEENQELRDMYQNVLEEIKWLPKDLIQYDLVPFLIHSEDQLIDNYKMKKVIKQMNCAFSCFASSFYMFFEPYGSFDPKLFLSFFKGDKERFNFEHFVFK
jgi:hypothetical protein